MARSKEANTSTEWAQYRDPDFLRAMLIGLTIGCPLNKSLDHCLLQFDRSISFDEKVTWAESLTDKKIVELYSLHHQCFHSK